MQVGRCFFRLHTEKSPSHLQRKLLPGEGAQRIRVERGIQLARLLHHTLSRVIKLPVRLRLYDLPEDYDGQQPKTAEDRTEGDPENGIFPAHNSPSPDRSMDV